MKMNEPPKITISGQDQPASVANEFHVMHTPNDFVLTIIEAIPMVKYIQRDVVTPDGQKKNITQLQNDGIMQKVVGRFGMSPAAFKKMVSVVNQNLKQFENKFGEIAINPPEGLQ